MCTALPVKNHYIWRMTEQRIHYLDGLRGLLAIVVFVHHFLYAFFPYLVFGGRPEAFASGAWTLERSFALTPLNLLFNPGTAINFFFILSGYVQSLRYFQNPDPLPVQRALVKRYFRLALPTLAVVLFIFVLHRANLVDRRHFPPNPLTWNWISSMMPDNMDLPQTVWYGLLGCFHSKAQSYQVLWTMPVELYNSWLVLVLLLATHRVKNKALLYTGWLLVQLTVLEGYYAMSFTAGLLLAHLQVHSATFHRLLAVPWIKYGCLTVGIYLASFPFTGYENSSRQSMYALISFFDHVPHVISYAIGNFLLFCFLLHAPRAQKLLSIKPLQFFGNISFMFYLLHLAVLFSFSPWLFLRLFKTFHNSPSNYLLTFLFSFAGVTLLSWLFHRLVDLPALRFSGWLGKYLLRTETPSPREA